MFVHESEPLEDLIDDVADCRFGEQFGTVLYHFVQVFFHVFKNEIQFVVLSTVDHLLELYHVGVLQFCK